MRTLRRIQKPFADHAPGDIFVSSMHVLSEFVWSKGLHGFCVSPQLQRKNAIPKKVWYFFELISEAKGPQDWVSTWTVYYERNQREKEIHYMHNLQL